MKYSQAEKDKALKSLQEERQSIYKIIENALRKDENTFNQFF